MILRYRVRLWRGTRLLWECETFYEPTPWEYEEILRSQRRDHFTVECLL